MFVSKRKNGIYHLYYQQPNGKLTSITTKQKYKSDALKFLSNFETELKYKQNNLTNQILLKDFAFKFLKFSESVHAWNSTLAIKATFNEFIKFFGNLNLNELSKNKIQNYVEYRLKKVSPYSVKRDVANLSGAFNWGIGQNYLKENYCKGIKKPAIPQKQPTYFSNEEFEKLLDAVDNEDLKDLIIFAANTGLRQMELLCLMWNQLDSINKYIVLNNHNSITKSKKVRTIPLNKTAFYILKKRRVYAQSAFIFTFLGGPIKQQTISHKFKKYVRRAKLNDRLNFHSLRHTFASWLIQKGASIYEVSKLLGHSNVKTTEIYANLEPDNLRKSVELLD